MLRKAERATGKRYAHTGRDCIVVLNHLLCVCVFVCVCIRVLGPQALPRSQGTCSRSAHNVGLQFTSLSLFILVICILSLCRLPSLSLSLVPSICRSPALSLAPPLSLSPSPFFHRRSPSLPLYFLARSFSLSISLPFALPLSFSRPLLLCSEEPLNLTLNPNTHNHTQCVSIGPQGWGCVKMEVVYIKGVRSYGGCFYLGCVLIRRLC